MRVYMECSELDDWGCRTVEFEFWPGGQLGKRTEYRSGTFYLRDAHVYALERLLTRPNDEGWDVCSRIPTAPASAAVPADTDTA